MAEVSFNIKEAGEGRGAGDLKDIEGLKKLKEVVNGNLDHTNLSAGAAITPGQLASEAKPVTWYTPKVIATEETRENTAFGTLTTKDEITGVVVPAGGLLLINYSAIVKSSVGGAGRVSIFIGANQLKKAQAEGAPVGQEASTAGTAFGGISTGPEGLFGGSGAGTSFVTTGEAVSAGGFCLVRRLAAGTYSVSVQYKATSGSITSKERLLQAEVHGF